MALAGKRGAEIAICATVLAVFWFTFPVLFNALFGLLIVRGFSMFLSHSGVSRGMALAFLVLGGCAVLIAIYFRPKIPLWPYLAIVSANVIVAYVFGNRLLRGKSSFLVEFVRQAHRGPEVSDEFGAFLDRQCMVWLLFAVASFAAGCVALVAEPLRPVANTGLGILVFAQIAWFAGSHKFAQHKYDRPENWRTSLRLMSNRKTWQNVEY